MQTEMKFQVEAPAPEDRPSGTVRKCGNVRRTSEVRLQAARWSEATTELMRALPEEMITVEVADKLDAALLAIEDEYNR